MNTALRRGAVVVLLTVSVACGGSAATSPTAASRPAARPSTVAPPTTSFPSPTGPSRTFVFERELSYRITDYTRQSRFILYDNGAFVLEYVGLGVGYRGGYAETNGVITFDWEGWSIAGPWGATGTVRGRTLTVQYNLIMQLTDFEDAVYTMTP